MTQPFQTNCCCGVGSCCVYRNGELVGCVDGVSANECASIGGVWNGGGSFCANSPCTVNTCRPCETGVYCSSLPYGGVGSCPPGVWHTSASVCMLMTFDSVNDPALIPLIGRTFPMAGFGGSPAVAMTTYWRIVGNGQHPLVQIGTTVFRMEVEFWAESERSTVGACPLELGCIPYTGANSKVRLSIDATPKDFSIDYQCPATGGHIAGPTLSFTDTIFRPVNPCDIGQVITSFATVTIQLASGGQDTGLVPGDCGPPVDPVGACCIPDGSCVGNTTATQCQDLGGTWQGAFTSCANIQCPPPAGPLGACCYPDGTPCADVTQLQCQAGGGNWQGAGTSCAFVHCPPPTGGNTGACCVPQAGGFGLCSDNYTQQQCLNAQGLYLGDGTTCGFIDCPPPPYFAARVASKGFGDTLARFFRATGIERLVKRRAARTGKPCGCAKRQEALNRLIPYQAKG